MPSINCTEFSRLLAETVESHQSTDVAVLREHAAQCNNCQGQWLDALLVDGAVAKWKSSIPSVELIETILFRLADAEALAAIRLPAARSSAGRLTDQPPTGTPGQLFRRRLSRRSAIGLTTSCAALGLAIFLLNVNRPQRAPESSEVAATTARSESPEPRTKQAGGKLPGDVAQSGRESNGTTVATEIQTAAQSTGNARVDVLLRDASSAYLNLASEAADAVAAVTVLVPPPGASDDSPTSDDNEDRWVDEVQRELAPVTHQLGQAFEFLIQAVPAEKTPAT